jgi:hypothetical protein
MDMYNLPWGITPIQYNDNRKTEFHIGSVGSINNGPVTNNYYRTREESSKDMGYKSTIEDKIAMCLDRLMLITNDKKRIFYKQKHWIGVYRIMVDYGLGITNGDYKGFCDCIKQIHPEEFAIVLTRDSIKDAPDGRYNVPRKEWKYDPLYHNKREPYDEMCMVADTFEGLLREAGVIP